MKKETISGPPIGTKPATSKTAPAVEALAGLVSDPRAEAIHAIVDKAAADLEKLGLKFFIGAIDKQPTAADGGKVYVQSEMKGEDFCYMLDIALPTKQDAVNLGIWAGQLIQSRTNKK